MCEDPNIQFPHIISEDYISLEFSLTTNIDSREFLFFWTFFSFIDGLKNILTVQRDYFN